MKTVRAKRKPINPRVVLGSDNIFADLGFDPIEADELLAKAELTHQIYNRIKIMKLTQTQAAKRLGLSQPDVSKLMNARFAGYSTDRLISVLNALEMDVEIVVRPRKAKQRGTRGEVRVREAAAA